MATTNSDTINNSVFNMRFPFLASGGDYCLRTSYTSLFHHSLPLLGSSEATAPMRDPTFYVFSITSNSLQDVLWCYFFFLINSLTNSLTVSTKTSMPLPSANPATATEWLDTHTSIEVKLNVTILEHKHIIHSIVVEDEIGRRVLVPSTILI